MPTKGQTVEALYYIPESLSLHPNCLPPPSLASVGPLPRTIGGRETLACGWGGANSDDWRESLALCLLQYVHGTDTLVPHVLYTIIPLRLNPITTKNIREKRGGWPAAFLQVQVSLHPLGLANLTIVRYTISPYNFYFVCGFTKYRWVHCKPGLLGKQISTLQRYIFLSQYGTSTLKEFMPCWDTLCWAKLSRKL